MHPLDYSTAPAPVSRPSGRAFAGWGPQHWLFRDAVLHNLRLLAVLNFDFGLWTLAASNPGLFDETGMMENVQAVLLAAAVAVLLRRAVLVTGAARTAAIGFAFVCFCVCFREVDLRTFDVPDWVIHVTTGKIRNRLFFAGAAALGLYLLLRRRHLAPVARQLLSRDSRPLQLAVAMVVFAAALEDVFYHTRLNKFWEEGIETVAYGMVLHAAAAGYWMPREVAPDTKVRAAGSWRGALRSLAAGLFPGSPPRSHRCG